MEPPSETLTPSQLNTLARNLLEDTFPLVWIEGELGNVARPSSGHLDRTLKAERAQVRAGSPVGAKYDTPVDRESAFEILAKKAAGLAEQADAPQARTAKQDEDVAGGGFAQAVKDAVFGTKRRQGMVETMAKQTARTVGNQIGRQILRGIFGGITGRK